MRQILLFGDSLTQRGFDGETGGWASLLANDYIRRADIINRGYGGYNTEWCRLVLPQILPTMSLKVMALAIIFLGANDAVLPSNKHQHVPLGRYSENLADLIKILRNWKPQLPILLITPPAVYPPSWESHCLERGRPLDRSIEHTRKYVDACREVGRMSGVPVVDLYEAMEEYARRKLSGPLSGDSLKCRSAINEAAAQSTYDPKILDELLSDGLHLSAKGNRLLYQTLKRSIADNYPELISEAIPLEFPYHANVNTFDLSECLKP